MAEINFSLIVFTLLVGLSTGTFIFYGLWQFTGMPAEDTGQKLSRNVMAITLGCLGVAMLASATHLGKPFRFLNAFRNPSSMISQEGIWAIAFGVILLITVILTFKGKKISKALYVIGVLVSCGLLLVNSLVYVKASGFPAWSNGITIVYYFSSAVLLGVAAVYFISMKQVRDKDGKTMALVALAAVLAQIIVTVAFTLNLQFNVMTVTLPSTIGLDTMRWGIGLLIPAIIAYLAWSGKMDNKKAALAFMICVVVGETFSRLIFFMQGVHL